MFVTSEEEVPSTTAGAVTCPPASGETLRCGPNEPEWLPSIPPVQTFEALCGVAA
jgi:hypothetical protein